MSGYGPPLTPPGVPEVTVDDLDAAMAEGAAVIDVREPGEYTGGHVSGAVLIPMGQVVAKVGAVPKEGPVYVICATGQRSGKAAQWYRGQGIDARNVAGGTNGWVESGRPVVTGMQPR